MLKKCQRQWKVKKNHIPSRRWNSGEDQDLRPSTWIRDRLERGEEQEILRGESGLSSPSLQQADSTRDDAEAINDFWSITRDFICRHQLEPRVKLYVPREASFPIPLKHIDVTRTTHTSLDELLETHFEDYWNVNEDRDLSDAWTGFILFEWKGHLTDIHGPGWDARENKRPQDPTMYGQICGSVCLMQRNGKRSKSGLSRKQNSITPDDYVVSSSLNLRMRDFKRHLEKTLAGSYKFRCQQQALAKKTMNRGGETHRGIGKVKTKHACIVEAYESTRIRLEGAPWRYLEDHIAAKGVNSLSHYNLIQCLKH